MNSQYETPILLLIFNRLSTTEKVFEKISAQKPRFLFIASDGPRAGREGEVELVNKVRQTVLNKIDWDCDVKTLFRDENLGCGVAPYTAITWFFEHVEHGIILEDDCLPLDGFFNFCHEMLNYYKHDEHIYEICGTNLQAGKMRGDGSYYFSNYGGIWGWATWARAWKKYDYEMAGLEKFLHNKTIEQKFASKSQQKFWIKTLTNASKLGSWWDYQWLFTVWSNNGICIVPNGNLIQNIGFSSGGTHTLEEPSWYNEMTKARIDLTIIKHPDEIKVDIDADKFQFENTIATPKNNLIKRLLKKTFKR